MLYFKVVIASLVAIFALFIFAKLMGNRQISQLNLFDYINGITIGSIASELSISTSLKGVLTALVALSVFSLFGILLSLATVKSLFLRHIITGKALLLMEDGKIYRKNLLKAKLDINDILTQARGQGFFDLSEISYAIMENNGRISFLLKADARPPKTSELGLKLSSEKILSNVIIDGKLMADNLKKSGNDEQWLKTKLKSQGYGSISEVFLATVDCDNNLCAFSICNDINNKNVFD